MIIYIQGHIDVSVFQKTANEHGLDTTKLVFIFPGNNTHHGANTNLFSIKRGGGLAKPAGQLGELGYPVLSLPTTSMENWEKNLGQKAIVENAIADLYRAVGAGYSLLLPVREHSNSTYFDSSLKAQSNLEPSFWGANALTPNKPLANYYIQELDRLHAFIASPTDQSNPFWPAYQNGCHMPKDDPWLQKPTHRPLRTKAPAQGSRAENTAEPPLSIDDTTLQAPKQNSHSKKAQAQVISAEIAAEPPASNHGELNSNANLDFLMYGALLATGFASIAVALLAWPVITPYLVTAGIISAPFTSITAAGITITGIIGAATSYVFFQRHSQERNTSGLSCHSETPSL